MTLVLTYDDLVLKSAAEDLAQRLHLPCDFFSENYPQQLLLRQNGSVLLFKEKTWHELQIDFLSENLDRRVQKGREPKELLLRACGIKTGTALDIIDATAGLGRDAYLMANYGAHVLMLERSPILAYLLEEALERLQRLRSDLFLSLQAVDANFYLENLKKTVDVIYLDPMHPERKKSALVKIPMRILRDIVGADQDSEKLLVLARQKAKQRVVVKRPKHSDFLAGEKPQFSLTGKQCRFDVYLS